jgi:hypothetical protein
MLRDGFLRFCDDPDLACCRAEKELEQLRTENVRLQAVLAGLQELAKAKADGRLVVLPCKVGDTVYVDTRTFRYGEYAPKRHAEAVVTSVVFSSRRYIKFRIFSPYVNANKIFKYPLSSFGKTVFLTREEAEKALQEGLEWNKRG